MNRPTLALILNTYEQPDYLSRVLRAVTAQTLQPDQVILADDGSGKETRSLFAAWTTQQSFRCEHAWQDHRGFRRAAILNEAIARTAADVVVFLDGDTIPHPAFLRDHRDVARPAHFVQGHRCLVERKGVDRFGYDAFTRDRIRALFTLQLRGLTNAFRWPAEIQRRRNDLRGIRGCNLGIWREDLVKVNGYNEAFEGWGREDSELAVRLMNNGIQRLDVRGRCICFHLWHPPTDRSALPNNDHLLENAIRSKSTRCVEGLDRHRRTP